MSRLLLLLEETGASCERQVLADLPARGGAINRGLASGNGYPSRHLGQSGASSQTNSAHNILRIFPEVSFDADALETIDE
ncbi:MULTISPECIES: hypothetical protein [Pseudomonas]|uniref:hypothetical protein n=1 Tax=Pseudomonas TaxID=286 RepID=UPI00129A7C3F|nr:MULTISPECIES: hypothetical protein [Pseudomonas]MBH3460880.1 hypothetical protein [Pseudomonas putida]MBK0059929.1 hypothetical protein [Pseudomonas sp. S44]